MKYVSFPCVALAAYLLFAVALGTPTTVQAQDEEYTHYSGFSVDTTPVLPEQETHPSLYFATSDVAALQERIQQSDYQDIWRRIEEDAEDYLDETVDEQDESDQPRMAKTLAFWWLMKGSTAARDKAIEALVRAYEGIPETLDKPYDDIYRATWLQNYCAAYDWLHAQLTPEQDSTARARIADEAQWMLDNLNNDKPPRPHNHRSKPAWAIATAALTLSEHPDAETWLHQALKWANTVTKYQFSADGIYREGSHYWMYNVVNMIPFLYHYLNVSGVDLFPTYRPAFIWPVKVRMSRGWLPNIEDGWLKPAPTHMVAQQYLDAETDLNPSASLGNVLEWNWETTDVFEVDYTGATNDVTWAIDEFILWDSSIEAAPPTRDATVNMDGGQTVFRNKWNDEGPNQRYLFFQGTPPGDNHNHLDLLSFIIEARGSYLIADAGYGPDGYTSDRRDSWYTTPQAHNVLTIDGGIPFSEHPFYSNNTPRTPYFLDSDFFGFAEKRVSGGFGRLPETVKHRRGIGFIGRDYFVVTDLVEAEQERTFRAYLHGRGRFEREGHYATWRTFDDTYGNAARMHSFLYPSSTSLDVQDSYMSLFKDGRRTSYVTMEKRDKDAAFMQVLVPGAVDSERPNVTDLSTDAYTASQVIDEDTTDTFLLQHESTSQSLGAFTTDGTFAWSRQVSGRVEQMALREGSSFSGGQTALKITEPVTVAVDMSNRNQWFVRATAPDAITFHLDIQHPGSDALQEVYVNGEQRSFDRDEETITVDASAKETAAERLPGDNKGTQFGNVTNAPNPFSQSTRITYHIETPGQYRLDVYDTLGRRVQTLRQNYHRTGTHQVTWQASSEQGGELSSGVYFFMLRSNETGQVASHKLVIIR